MNWRFLSITISFLAVVLVITFAIAFSFTTLMADSIYGIKRQLFVAILVAYGVYRGYRLYRMFKTSRDENS